MDAAAKAKLTGTSTTTTTGDVSKTPQSNRTTIVLSIVAVAIASIALAFAQMQYGVLNQAATLIAANPAISGFLFGLAVGGAAVYLLIRMMKPAEKSVTPLTSTPEKPTVEAKDEGKIDKSDVIPKAPVKDSATDQTRDINLNNKTTTPITVEAKDEGKIDKSDVIPKAPVKDSATDQTRDINLNSNTITPIIDVDPKVQIQEQLQSLIKARDDAQALFDQEEKNSLPALKEAYTAESQKKHTPAHLEDSTSPTDAQKSLNETELDSQIDAGEEAKKRIQAAETVLEEAELALVTFMKENNLETELVK